MRARVILCAALLAAGVALAGCGGFGTPAGYTIEAQFSRTFNLFPGSPVRVLGINVGLVETLEVEPGGDVVIARLRIDHDVQLPADVRAIILTDSLLGERVVQLDPPYGDGDTFPAGGRIEDPGAVPAEFDELLTALNDFVVGMQEGDLPRLVDNLADVLDGQGDNIGRALEDARDAMGVLSDHDDDLVQLASKLADLNQTLNTRRFELTRVVQDFATLSQVLADQRVPLNDSLVALARLADETSRLLQANRSLIERDVETVTRVGRTVHRNLDHVSGLILHSAELFRGAERAGDREHNWLPLVNNTEFLVVYLLETVPDRVIGLCLREGIDLALCEDLGEVIGGVLASGFCLEPLIPCTEPADADATPDAPLIDGLTGALEDHADTLDDEDQDALRGVIDDLIGSLTRTGGQQ